MKKIQLFFAINMLLFASAMAQDNNNISIFSRIEKQNFIALDYNSDGADNELLIVESSNHGVKISVLETTGNSFYTCFEQYMEDINFNKIGSRLVSGDFDNDGTRDDFAAILETGLAKTQIVAFLYNQGKFTNNTFWTGPDFDARETTSRIVSGDFDNDGFIDDIATMYNYDSIRTKIFVWKSDGNKFEWPGTWWIGPDYNALRSSGTFVSGDFDNDGYMDDIASIYNYSNKTAKIFVWKSKRNSFEWPMTTWESSHFDVTEIYGKVFPFDYNSDGYYDLGAIKNIGNDISSIIVWEGNRNNMPDPQEKWIRQNSKIEISSMPICSNFRLEKNWSSIVYIGNSCKPFVKSIAIHNKEFSDPDLWWGTDEACDEGCEFLLNTTDINYLEINIFPNPGNGMFHFNGLTDGEKYRLTILNSAGILLKNKTIDSNSNSVDLSDYPSGIYFAKIIYGNTQKILKFSHVY